jgi:hypothetical protein
MNFEENVELYVRSREYISIWEVAKEIRLGTWCTSLIQVLPKQSWLLEEGRGMQFGQDGISELGQSM